MNTRRRVAEGIFVAVVAGLIVATVIGIFSLVKGRWIRSDAGAQSSRSANASAGVAKTATASPSISTSASPASAPSQSGAKQSKSPAPPPPDQKSSSAKPSTKTLYLQDLDAVQEEIHGRVVGCTGGCTGFHGGSAVTGGRNYSESFILDLDSRGNLSTATWNLAGSCSTLTATLGSEDDTPAEIQFSIQLDGGSVRDSVVIGEGKSRTKHFDVRGASLVTIRASVTEPTEDFNDVFAVLGDASVRCRSDASLEHG